MSEDGHSALTAFIGAFERVNGRPPTAEENREALALVEVVRAAQLDPFLVFYLANKRAQDALERVPAETQSVIDEAIIKVRELIERATCVDPLLGRQRPGAGTLATTKAARSPEPALQPSVLPGERLRRTEVIVPHGSYRGFIAAYVLATATIAFTSWAVGGYSIHVVPTLLVVAAFVSGVAGTAVVYELRRP